MTGTLLSVTPGIRLRADDRPRVRDATRDNYRILPRPRRTRGVLTASRSSKAAS
jgi:hypothetical protein